MQKVQKIKIAEDDETRVLSFADCNRVLRPLELHSGLVRYCQNQR